MNTHNPCASAPRPLALRLSGVLCLALASLLGACATQTKPYDYTAFKAAHPASVLVLPPLNDSKEVNATPGVLAQATMPLAEAGYYVLPVTLVNETFKNNGLTQAADIQAVSTTKLHDIFGADAALYMRVKQYGATYTVVSGAAVVVLEARLVDLRTGTLLWEGSSRASSDEGQSNQGGVIGMLIKAVIEQVSNTISDASYKVAGAATYRLLNPAVPNGILPGPRLPAKDK